MEIDGGPNRLRIARAYFEPQPPGDIMGERSFELRAVLPDMDPAAGRGEGPERNPASRVVRVGYRASFLAPVHSARTRMAREAARLGTALDDFTPASPATMGWRARLGRNPNGNVYRQADLFWADLPGRGFVGAECRVGGTDGRRYDPEVCILHLDWRGRRSTPPSAVCGWGNRRPSRWRCSTSTRSTRRRVRRGSPRHVRLGMSRCVRHHGAASTTKR